MPAEIISIKAESFNAMVKKTKAAWERADATKADADEWALRTGKYLVELKQRSKEEGKRWFAVLKELGRSERRARELMELAGGEVTIEQQRDRAREGMQKSRAKQKAAKRYAAFRDIPATPDDEDEYTEADYAGPPMEERLEISLRNLCAEVADLCGRVLAREPYFDKQFPGWRNVKLPSDVKTLVREASTALASLAATVAAK